MKKNKNLLLFSTAISILPTALLSISCINDSLNKNLKRPDGFEVINNLDNPEKEKTDKIINNLLNINFRKNEFKKIEFIKSQNQEEKLKKEIKDISQKYKKNSTEENLKLLFSFYSKNWLFILKNIKNFEWSFLEWWKFPETAEAKHSQEFINKLNDLDEPKNVAFLNNNLDQLKEGDESSHSKNGIFYLKKEKFIFRFIINSNGKGINFDKIIYFNKSRTKKISIRLISNIIHNGLIHKNQQGYDDFEKNIINNYSYPSIGFLLAKDK
ncbi:hypothetical protein DMC14_000985 [Metamycoplasma phocicerebrale]|uniref:Lipoprotein n=1 Tax=Metamycoplasma phocicerebrale TaxID=142649 RepID=A0A3Q9V2W9_9BACT|nr:aromatic motif membrane protein [Metamycoplasma phocicerebrale]AZZ65368.1 hypothetical protein DMC14_000985 [Metamycoplasma phocicerebrale]